MRTFLLGMAASLLLPQLALAQLLLSEWPIEPKARLIIEIGPELESRGIGASDLRTEFLLFDPGVGRELHAQLGHPLAAEALIHEPFSPRELDEYANEEWFQRLRRYAVLSYESPSRAEAARIAVLSAPGRVRSAGIDVTMELTATPGDYWYGSRQQNLQQMNFPSAWNSVWGHADVAVIDTGIKSSHPDLQNSFRPHFSRNSAIDNTGSGGVNWDATNVDEQYSPTATSQTYAGHGSHVAGIISADVSHSGGPTGFPGDSAGVAGACWYCSLHVAKVSRLGGSISLSDAARGVVWAARRGAQVMNMSFGSNSTNGGIYSCPSANTGAQAMCDAISLSSVRDVILVAAAGNSNLAAEIDFPAKHANVVPVGAVTSSGSRWTQPYGSPATTIGSNSGPELQTQGVVAPGMNIYSSIYTGKEWNPDIPCGESYLSGVPSGGSLVITYDSSVSAATGYGGCTGTSMAAPHVTALFALMRSVDPLDARSSLRSKLRAASSRLSAGLSATTDMGAGIPNASLAVQSVMSTTNRLTPLFAFEESATYSNRFYTANPQMASAAWLGTLLPGRCLHQGDPCSAYNNVGTTLMIGSTSYYLPGIKSQPGAEVWIFTTHDNPYSTANLVPLYRVSYFCDSSAISHPACSSRPYDVDHAYATTWSEVTSYIASGYRYDGIEGYVYPASSPQPAGTVALRRGYNSSRHDTGIFPSTLESTYVGLGYGSITTLGYAYLNNGTRPNLAVPK